MLIVYCVLIITGIVMLLVFEMNEGLRKRVTRMLKKNRINSYLMKAYPYEDSYIMTNHYYRRKIRVFFTVMILGLSVASIYEFCQLNNQELLEGNLIKRNGYLKGSKIVSLDVRNLITGEQTKVNVNVEEKKYTKEQITLLADEAGKELLSQVIGSNTSIDQVYENLSFTTSLSNYPFLITWRTDDPLLISNKGIISEERFEKLRKTKDVDNGILTGIHATLKYDDFSSDVNFYVRIYPKNEGKELSLQEYIEEIVSQRDDLTNTEEYLSLPVETNDALLEYSESKNNKSLILFVMTIVITIILYLREDYELKDKIKKRDTELLSDYPRLVNKFVLFYSAGMTTRGIFSKICSDYRKREDLGKKRYLYEEMMITEGKMEEGLSERQAYDDFANRCGLHKYRVLINLITQSMERGREDLLFLLEKEAGDSFVDRKNKAKELGEEAGTKLLLPMFMMLIVVIIIVMIPAFMTFRM